MLSRSLERLAFVHFLQPLSRDSINLNRVIPMIQIAWKNSPFPISKPTHKLIPDPLMRAGIPEQSLLA